MTEQEDLHKSLERLARAREKAQFLYEEYSKARDEVKLEQDILYYIMRAQKLLTARTEQFTATVAKRNKLVVEHPDSVKNWLNDNPGIEPDAYIKLDVLALDRLAKQCLKQTGEIIPGTHYEQTEYISLRTNKKEKTNGRDQKQ